MKEKEISFPASNGEHDIRALIWSPDRASDVKAVYQLSHGMCEYSERYREFGEYLTKNGFVVAINDHAGHGKSVKDAFGYFGKGGCFSMVEDMRKLYVLMKQDHPRSAHFLLGHSMGSFLARMYAAKHGADLDGAVFSGTGSAPAILPIGYAISRLLVKTNGAKAPGAFLHRLSAGSYNKRFAPIRTESDWLSRDNELVDLFISDERSRFFFTNSGYRDMFRIFLEISRPQWAKSLPKTLPILLFSGSEDPVGGYGSGVFKVFRSLADAGVSDVEMKLYGQGRHEMLNEINRAEVYEDVLNWTDARIKRKKNAPQ
ncbi:MAG: lysophospholipase [Clostridiales bacterium]|jgi:alpha-beta hydrolase superfamily lysophospholipase|nr:lysophospholipase [Clostridiales bacterium]